jgi:hypothetical protein
MHQFKIIVYLILLNFIYSHLAMDSLVNKYEAIVDNFVMDSNGLMTAINEISTNKQIMILPTSRIISSEENYQFKEYFSRSGKEKLLGRLLIERFIGNASYYYEFIDSLPKPDDLLDYYHYSEENKEQLEIRSYIRYSWKDRRNDYDTLIRKIPSNVRLI